MSLQAAEALLRGLVFGNRNAASTPARRVRAVLAQIARSAYLGGEVHGRAELEDLHLSGGARDCLPAKIEPEVSLRVQAGTGGTLGPRFGEHLAAALPRRLHERTVHVGAIDVDFGEGETLMRDVLANRRGPLLLPVGSPGSPRRPRSPVRRGRARCAPCSHRSACCGSCDRGASARPRWRSFGPQRRLGESPSSLAACVRDPVRAPR